MFSKKQKRKIATREDGITRINPDYDGITYHLTPRGERVKDGLIRLRIAGVAVAGVAVLANMSISSDNTVEERLKSERIADVLSISGVDGDTQWILGEGVTARPTKTISGATNEAGDPHITVPRGKEIILNQSFTTESDHNLRGFTFSEGELKQITSTNELAESTYWVNVTKDGISSTKVPGTDYKISQVNSNGTLTAMDGQTFDVNVVGVAEMKEK